MLSLSNLLAETISSRRIFGFFKLIVPEINKFSGYWMDSQGFCTVEPENSFIKYLILFETVILVLYRSWGSKVFIKQTEFRKYPKTPVFFENRLVPLSG